MKEKGRGAVAKLTAQVDRIVQTGGPTVFHITDGTGMFAIKSFVGPGERAHPNVVEGDVVNITCRIEEFQGELEGEAISFIKQTEAEKHKFVEQLKEKERERAAITPPEFMVKDQILEKLKDRYIQAATEIRLAVIQNRPIIVRHHNDADGYSSGFTLEKAILPLIKKQHSGAKAPWEYFTRAPCSAPFYEIDDSIRDTARSLSNVAKFSEKMPLVIIADNGSSQEDLLGIKQGKVHGIEFIVVDHHLFEEDVISSEVLVHINPFLVEEDGAQFSAGMLCAELARFINPDVENIEQIPAMAGLADRIKNEKTMDAYFKIAEKAGYEKQLLADISTVIDFVSAKLRFLEAREYIEVVFGEPHEKQKALVDVMAPYIRNLDAKGLNMAQAGAKVEKIGPVTLQTIDIHKAFPGFGFFPKPGRAVGLAHDQVQVDKKLSSVVTAGLMDTAITFRATDGANFSVHDFIALVEEKIPEAFVNGGGHKNAGSINFVPSQKEKIVKLLKEFIKASKTRRS